MSSASTRGWGPGWPNCSRDKIATLVVGRNSLRLPVRREVAAIFGELVRKLEASRGAGFRPDWSWGYACRSISGTNKPSNHSWGLAIDLDAPQNPYQSAAWHRSQSSSKTGWGGIRLVSTMPENTPQICEPLMIRWGGFYRSKPDPMHFEFMGTPEDARRITATLPTVPGGGGPAPQPTTPPSVRRLLRITRPFMRGDDVRFVQNKVGVKADGIYGNQTAQAVREWQRQSGLTPDGIVGPLSWNHLLRN